MKYLWWEFSLGIERPKCLWLLNSESRIEWETGKVNFKSHRCGLQFVLCDFMYFFMVTSYIIRLVETG